MLLVVNERTVPLPLTVRFGKLTAGKLNPGTVTDGKFQPVTATGGVWNCGIEIAGVANPLIGMVGVTICGVWKEPRFNAGDVYAGTLIAGIPIVGRLKVPILTLAGVV